MVKYTLAESDKELILQNHVLPVVGISDQDVDSILWFLDNFQYQPGYKPGLYFNRPADWTKAYTQAVDKVVCSLKYGDVLSNIMV